MRTFAFLFLSAITACSSSPTTGGGVDGGPTEGGGGQDGDRPAGGCTDLVELSPGVVHALSSDPAPTPSGGAISDGTYVNTQIVYYGTDKGGTGLSLGTLRFANGVVEEAQGTANHSKSSFTVSGATINFTEVCPSAGLAHSESFTATPTTFAAFSKFGGETVVKTYTKQ